MKHHSGPYTLQFLYEQNPGDYYNQKIKEIHIIGPEKDNGWNTHLAKIAIHNMKEDEAIDTAKLLAAAPEMYECLEAIQLLGDDHIHEMIEKVLTKIRGEK